MKNKLFFIVVLIATFAYSQKKIISSGGNASGNGTVSYSVGQVIYTSNNNSSGTVSQGIQQGFEFFPLSNADFKALDLEAIMYPNPTQDKINIVLKNIDLKGLTYKMYDVKGVEVSNGKVYKNSTTLSMSKLAKGVYILKVNQENIQLKSFKIIKK